MSIAIKVNKINTQQLNRTQLYGMITRDKNLATKLEGREAFKNSFIKILNHLPGVSIEDKEEKLREIYYHIYSQPEKDSGTFFNIGPLEEIWQALETLIESMDIDDARSIEFSFSRNNNDVTKTLHVTIAGNELPSIVLDNNPENDSIYHTILDHYATPKDTNDSNNPTTVHKLKQGVLNVGGNRVSLAFEAKSLLSYTAMFNNTNAGFREVGL